MATPEVKLQFISSIFESFRGTRTMESDDLESVQNGVFRMFKDGAVLPQRMPKGTAEYDGWYAKLPQIVENGKEEYDGWLAKTRGHHDNKHAEEHKDGTYLATCLECSAGPITIDDKVSEVKKWVYGKLTAIKGTHAFWSIRRCQKCRKKHRNWRIEIKATAPVAKKTVVKKAAPRKHNLFSLSCFCMMVSRRCVVRGMRWVDGFSW